MSALAPYVKYSPDLAIGDRVRFFYDFNDGLPPQLGTIVEIKADANVYPYRVKWDDKKPCLNNFSGSYDLLDWVDIYSADELIKIEIPQ